MSSVTSMGGSSGRYAQLDALRAVAVVGVIAAFTLPHVWARNGVLGVQLFFVISGFVITGILLDARSDAERARTRISRTIRAFYARRFLRIVPLYALVLFVAAAVGFISVRDELGYHVFFVSNWWFADRGAWTATTDHLWTLAAQAQFYVVWPIVVLTMPRRVLGPIIVAMIVTAPVVRLVLFAADKWPDGVMIITPAVLDSLGLGALLAYVRRTRSTEWIGRRSRWIPLIALVLFVAWKAAQQTDDGGTIELTASGLWFPLLAVWVVDRASSGIRGPLRRVLEWRPLAFVGTISYGIYLMHRFVMAAMFEGNYKLELGLPTPARGPKRFVFVTVIAIVAAIVSWFVVERPINALKGRFPYVEDEDSGSQTEPAPTAV